MPSEARVPAFRKTYNNVPIEEFERVLRQVVESLGKKEGEVMELIGLTPTLIHNMRAAKRVRRVNFLALKSLQQNGHAAADPALNFDECLAVIRTLSNVRSNPVVTAARGKLAIYLAQIAPE